MVISVAKTRGWFRMSRITIIVPTFNSEKTIETCIRSLQDQDYPNYEIVVVDGGSKDKTLELIPSSVKKYVVEGNQAKAMNFGVIHSKSEWVAFIDSDCIATPTWLETLMKTQEELCKKGPSKIGVLCSGNFLDGQHPLIARLSWRVMGSWLGCGGGVHAKAFRTNVIVAAASSYNSLYNRELVLKLGGFDETLGGGEDVSMGEKLKKEGYKIMYVSGAEVCHLGRTTLKAFWKQMSGFGWSRGRFIKKSLKNLHPYHLMPLAVAIVGLTLSYFFPWLVALPVLILGGYGIKFAIEERDWRALYLTPMMFFILAYGWEYGLFSCLWKRTNPKDE